MGVPEAMTHFVSRPVLLLLHIRSSSVLHCLQRAERVQRMVTGVSDLPPHRAGAGTVSYGAEGAVDVLQEISKQEALLIDLWVGVVLVLMILSCICCVCSCFIYHKFVQWKRAVAEAALHARAAGSARPSLQSLPSYTLVSGLPTYDEALLQLQRMRQLRRSSSTIKAIEAAVAAAAAAGNRATVARLQILHVGEILHL